MIRLPVWTRPIGCRKSLWLARSQEKIQQLHDFLQQSIGEEVAYIEDVKVVADARGENGAMVLEIEFRCPFDANDRNMEHRLEIIVKKWIKESTISVTR